jgi:glycogen operon protein
MAISHGTMMMLGGDEWMRTQYGNNNAYTTGADNDWNWFRWGEWTSLNANNIYRHRMHDFVRTLIQFRRDRPHAFSPASWGEGLEIVWLSADGQPADETTWGSKHIQMHYADTQGTGHRELVVLINMEQDAVNFQLPPEITWARVLDTQAYFDLPGMSGEPTGWFDENLDADPFVSANASVAAPVGLPDATYQVVARSMVILEQED